MKLNKLNFLFFLFLILFLCFSSSPFAVANDIQKRGLETKYPPIHGIEITATSTIETYAVYLFSLAMIIGAILAFAVLIYGGFRYVTSAGNPLAMADARKWIWDAILGLILLLCAWLIIGIINKEILKPKVPEIKAISGIYLVGKDVVDKSDMKIPYSEDVVNSIPEYFEADHIEFISDPPEDINYANPDKDELCSVYIYDEKNLEGEAREEIPNTGAESTHPVSNVGSMFLLWQKPGVYLYKEEGYDKEFNNPPRPMFIQTSQTSFKEDFDNKIKSLKIVHDLDPSGNLQAPGYYYVVLFEEPNFNKDGRGKCEILLWVDAENFNDSKQIKDKISSVAVFKNEHLHGEIKFFDEIDCKSESKQYSRALTGEGFSEVTLSETQEEEVDEWNSLAINANAVVILNTEENGGGRVDKGYCRLFSSTSEAKNLKTTSIYHKCYGAADCEEYQPKNAFIMPRQE